MLRVHALVSFCFLALILSLPASQAQTPDNAGQEPITTLKLKTSVVAVSAVVRGKNGEPAPGLSKDDFILKQDGKEVPIRYFSQGSDLPLTFAVMVDTSSSQHAFIGDETLASDVFFETMLGHSRENAQDRALLVQFASNILNLAPLTGSPNRLHLALLRLEQPHPALPGGGGTLLYDAIAKTSREWLAGQTGRKAIVLLTDGDDHGSRLTLEQALEAAQRADVSIYAVFYSLDGFGSLHPQSRLGGAAGHAALEQLATATGGRVFTVTPAFGLHAIYEQIGEDLRLQYEIGYTPPADTRPDSFHRIELKARDRKLNVQARVGFYSSK